MSTLFTPPAPIYLPVAQTSTLFPVHRVYCIGRNYLAHAKEMGSVVDRERPIFFMKPADALQPDGDVPYPSATQNLHYEVEMVIASSRVVMTFLVSRPRIVSMPTLSAWI